MPELKAERRLKIIWQAALKSFFFFFFDGIEKYRRASFAKFGKVFLFNFHQSKPLIYSMILTSKYRWNSFAACPVLCDASYIVTLYRIFKALI